MATNYILSAAGTTNPILELTAGGATLEVPTLQDVTVNNSVDIFTWTQLNEGSKLSVPTTASNSISANLVVESTTFFGTGTGTSATALGLFGLSNDKVEVTFAINLGTKTISGTGYVTGLAPAVSADSPVWVSPVTITVSGDYTVT